MIENPITTYKKKNVPIYTYFDTFFLTIYFPDYCIVKSNSWIVCLVGNQMYIVRKNQISKKKKYYNALCVYNSGNS